MINIVDPLLVDLQFSPSWALNTDDISADNKQLPPELQSKIKHMWLLTLITSLTHHLVFFCPSTGVLCFSELFFIKEPHDVTVVRRDAVILDCRVKGESPIDVRWLKNGVRVLENQRVYQLSNGSLYISEVESKRGDKSDDGLYQCLAQNKYGAVVSQKARLTIASRYHAGITLVTV